MVISLWLFPFLSHFDYFPCSPVEQDDLRKCLTMADLEITPNNLDKIVKWVFQFNPEGIGQHRVMQRLADYNLKRGNKKM